MANSKRNTKEKISIFRRLFTGLTNVYGTYDLFSGRSRQEKTPVTNKVILSHLKGQKPYGVYLLVHDRIRAIAVDFDTPNQLPPMEFMLQAKHYGIDAYIERSKSKGYHAWIFFEKHGVLASKARVVTKHLLDEIEEREAEIFPKQDKLNPNVCYGNFINAPLFGAMVPKGKTVFVNPTTFQSYDDQWALLASVKKCNQSLIDEIIELNDLSNHNLEDRSSNRSEYKNKMSFGLPVCAQNMLKSGVTKFQRISCFRLAVHLKRIGLPEDLSTIILKSWANKNKPDDNKRIITEKEIVEQTLSAFKNGYRGYGCDSEAVAPFCDSNCPLKQKSANPF